jgi:hypothetical protein
VFRLALRQTEGLISSILRLLGLDLAVPDHSTLSRRAEALEVPETCISSRRPVHLLADSTGLRLCGPGEWLIEKHGTRRRRAWRKLHIGMDAEAGQILATELTTHDVDDGSQVGPLFEQVEGSLASLTGDGTYDRADVYDAVSKLHPDADVAIPPRSTAVTERHGGEHSDPARSASPKHRSAWTHGLAEAVRVHASGSVEAAISRLKRAIGDALGSRTDRRRGTEVAIVV